MAVRLPEEIRPVMDNGIPAVMVTCSAAGVPNTTVISQVYYVDESHVALSFQFFNKTIRNVRENPRANVTLQDIPGFTLWILDLQFVSRAEDGSIAAIQLADLDLDGSFDVAVFEGASAGLLDESDLDDAKDAIAPGSSAGILIFENRWATRFVQALRGGDAQLVAAGYIPLADIAASLDATDS